MTGITLADAERAHAEWAANCGPAALAAVLGLALDQVRPHLVGFDAKRYTNPTMMFGALKSLGAKYCMHRPRTFAQGRSLADWPVFGLCRVQWEGPWTAPGVPMRARYRYTHWIGCKRRGVVRGEADIGIFDVNCLNNGTGWCSLADWARVIAPWLAEEHDRRSTGAWHLTHAIAVDREDAR